MRPSLPDLTRRIENDSRASAFVAFAKALASGRQLAEIDDPRIAQIKTAVAAQNSGTDSAMSPFSRAYVSVLESQTLVGRMTTTPAPVGVSLGGIRSADWPDAEWLAEGAAMPLARIEQQAPRTSIGKFGVVLAFSSELAKLTDSRAERLFEAQMTRGLRRAEDRLLLSDEAAVDQQQPEGLLHGVSSIATSSPASLDLDLVDLWTSVANGEAFYPYFICSPRGAMYLATLHDDGAPRFPNVGPKGGDIAGVPVLTSPAAANKLILAAAEHLVVTDEGLEVGRSTNASVVMTDGPTMSSVVPTPANVTSAWQTGRVVLKAVRYLHWTKLRGDMAGFLTLPIGGSPA